MTSKMGVNIQIWTDVPKWFRKGRFFIVYFIWINVASFHPLDAYLWIFDYQSLERNGEMCLATFFFQSYEKCENEIMSKITWITPISVPLTNKRISIARSC